MHAIGLAVPQVSELAHCLNRRHGTRFFFLGLEEAYATLARHQAERATTDRV